MIVIKPISILAPGALVSSNVAETDAYPAQVLTKIYAAGEKVTDPSTHQSYESKLGASAAVTVTAATPGVVTWNAHGLAIGTPISFSATGSMPAPLVAGTVYYVVSAPSVNTLTVSATAGGGAIATSTTGSGVTATAGQNLGRSLTDKTYWLPVGVTNRWKMFDTYNNTQTANAEEIVVEILLPQVCRGMYLGNIDANLVDLTLTVPGRGVVFDQTFSQVVSGSGSSFYGWCYNPLRKKSYFVSVTLPPFAGAVLKIRLRKPGGTAKCGVCVVGTLLDVGLSQYGLGTDIKDYSTTKFDFDGTSTTTERGYAKRMTLDVVLKNDMIDYVQETLAELRQVPCVYVGTIAKGSAILFGKYSSFKNIIQDYSSSKMALQIEGTV